VKEIYSCNTSDPYESDMQVSWSVALSQIKETLEQLFGINIDIGGVITIIVP
jgi:hypothetical protein